MVASKLNVGPSSSIDSMLFKFQLVLVVIVNIDVSIVKKFKQTPHLAGCVAGEGGEGYDHQEEEDGFGTATSNQILSWMDFSFLIKVFLGKWQNIFFFFFKKNNFGQSRTFFDWSRTLFDRSRTFFDRSRTFSIGVELFSSSTLTEKSSTALPEKCWTLEYSGELEFSSPFMEQWTLDAGGVLKGNGRGMNARPLRYFTCASLWVMVEWPTTFSESECQCQWI